MKNIKLIIFDLDGTLVNAYQAIIKSFNYTMRKLDYPVQDALTIRRAVGWGDENLLKPFLNKKDLMKALIIYRKHHKQSLRRYSRVFPETKRVLGYLRNKGYKLAVASNRPTRFSRILIRHLGLIQYLDYMLCADKLKHGKPHPEILKKIIHKFFLNSEETLYIGDMAVDVRAGRRAKVRTIAITTGSSTQKELREERPHWIIRRITELLKLL